MLVLLNKFSLTAVQSKLIGCCIVNLVLDVVIVKYVILMVKNCL